MIALKSGAFDSGSGGKDQARQKQVCAFIEPAHPDCLITALDLKDNEERLARQLGALGVNEVHGLGEIPVGASVLILKVDIVFAFSSLAALIDHPGQGALFGDSLAAVHVQAGDAAAALAKFRKQDHQGWAPFHVRFRRLGAFSTRGQKLSVLSLFSRKAGKPFAKALRIPVLVKDGRISADAALWRQLPGLDPFVNFSNVERAQFACWRGFSMTAGSWRAIGILLFLMALSLGVLQIAWLGAAALILGVIACEIAAKDRAFFLLSDQLTPSAQCYQAVSVAVAWLFVVFAAGEGAVAKLPALVLMALPIAFLGQQFVRRISPLSWFERAALGANTHIALAVISAVFAREPEAVLISKLTSITGLLLLTGLIGSTAYRLAKKGAARTTPLLQDLTNTQPAE